MRSNGPQEQVVSTDSHRIPHHTITFPPPDPIQLEVVLDPLQRAVVGGGRNDDDGLPQHQRLEETKKCLSSTPSTYPVSNSSSYSVSSHRSCPASSSGSVTILIPTSPHLHSLFTFGAMRHILRSNIHRRICIVQHLIIYITK